MKRALCSGFLLCACLTTVLAGDDTGAHFLSASGNVEIRRATDSSAIIGFSTLSTFVLKPESEIVIDQLSPGNTRVQLIDGHKWANVKQMAVDGILVIAMDSAVAGITGTNITCGSSRSTA